VRKSNFFRAEYSCRNAVTHSLQCRDDGGKLSVSVPRHVLAEETRRPHGLDDGEDLVEQPSVVVGTEHSPGDAVWLARVARHDAIHNATPRDTVEGGNV
jgi:hypothetical protein